MQKIDILGITITDYSLKESLLKADDFIKSGAVSMILYVTAPMLILAGKDIAEKERILSMDMLLCGDADILKVAKIESKSRQYEVEKLIFLKEFLRRTARGGKTVYLLSDTEEDALVLRKELEMYQRGIRIEGLGIVDANTEDMEEVVNNINAVAPAIIISRLALGRQEQLMIETRPYVNAEVWLGLSKDMKLGEKQISLRKKAMNGIYKKIIRHKISKYNGDSEKE